MPRPRPCPICLRKRRGGIRCGAMHFVCRECFTHLLSAALKPGATPHLTTSLGQLRCPTLTCNEFFSPHQIPTWPNQRHLHNNLITLRTLRIPSTPIPRPSTLSYSDQLKSEVFELLTLKCPVCTQAFDKFYGCLALTCFRCHSRFCGYCFYSEPEWSSDSVHCHVRCCAQNPVKGNIFLPTRQIYLHYEDLKVQKVVSRLQRESWLLQMQIYSEIYKEVNLIIYLLKKGASKTGLRLGGACLSFAFNYYRQESGVPFGLKGWPSLLLWGIALVCLIGANNAMSAAHRSHLLAYTLELAVGRYLFQTMFFLATGIMWLPIATLFVKTQI